MCVIAWRWTPDEEIVLTLWANRDEWLKRPTRPLAPWRTQQSIIGGRDLEAGGGWLLVDRHRGDVAALTNLREASGSSLNEPQRPSRGELPVQALLNRDFSLEPEQASRYAGFNLIVFRQAQRFAQQISNSDEKAVKLHRGTGSISNGKLSEKWPKQQALESAIDKAQHLHEVDWLEAAWKALSDQSQPDPLDLPDTGVGTLRERELAPVFINTPSYGTRQSTVIKRSSKGHLKIWERRWTGHGGALRHSDVFWTNKHD